MINRPQLFRKLYSALLTLCIPLFYLRMLWRSRKNPAYRQRWLERLGFFDASRVQPGGIWLHAVSVGETLASVPLIQALKKEFPSLTITVTSSTPNGSARVLQVFDNQVFHVYFPYDLTWIWVRFLNKIRPKLCLIMETELWPNCLWMLKKRALSTVIVNGRLSLHSLNGYRRIPSTAQFMMSCLTNVAAQSNMDGERFIALGLKPSQLLITGNIKFDIHFPPEISEKAQQLKAQWGIHRPVLIAASTHDGEEKIMVEVFQSLRKTFPEIFLILAPRHIERCNEIKKLLTEHSFNFSVRSSGTACSPDTDVLLANTLGEMPLFYSASDCAFVGGSLVPIGGHNMLEPAYASIPIVVGPHVSNFLEITDHLLKSGGLIQIQGKERLLEVLSHWFSSNESRILAGQKARQAVDQNRGAVDRVLRLIRCYL